MELWLESIVRVGTAPVVAMYLLYDYSRKLSSMQKQMTIFCERMDNNTQKLEKIEDLIRDICKK